MKTTALSLVVAAGAASANLLEARASGVQGFDISSYQGTVDFSGAYDSGARFVMIKVRAGSSLTNLDRQLISFIGHRRHDVHRQFFLQPL
jgi:GH25 family lysozyme M1 (1,4-beta-N-acetylmuramidase)